jgi:hypothetical protein
LENSGVLEIDRLDCILPKIAVSISQRLASGVLRQDGQAARAALTARSTSFSPAEATVVKTCANRARQVTTVPPEKAVLSL